VRKVVQDVHLDGLRRVLKLRVPPDAHDHGVHGAVLGMERRIAAHAHLRPPKVHARVGQAVARRRRIEGRRRQVRRRAVQLLAAAPKAMLDDATQKRRERGRRLVAPTHPRPRTSVGHAKPGRAARPWRLST